MHGTQPKSTVNATKKKAKKTGHKKGLWAESLCVWALRLKGYRILEQRYKTKTGEIDIIAKRGKTVAMVEVKYRKTLTDAAQAITPKNKARIIRTAQMFLAKQPKGSVHLSNHVVRFDVMLVCPKKMWPTHIQGAFGA